MTADTPSTEPKTVPTTCPNCDEDAYVTIPRETVLATDDEAADGLAQASCNPCECSFSVPFHLCE